MDELRAVQMTLEDLKNYIPDDIYDIDSWKIRNAGEQEQCEYWTLQNNGNIVSRMFFIHDLPDIQIADGVEYAYIGSFRETNNADNPGHDILVNAMADRIMALGFKAATIGIASTDVKTLDLYKDLGFDIVVEEIEDDPLDSKNHVPFTILKMIFPTDEELD